MNLHPYRSFTLHLGFQIGVEDLVKWHELRREICSVGIVRCLVGLNEQGRVAAGLDPVDMIVTTNSHASAMNASCSMAEIKCGEG